MPKSVLPNLSIRAATEQDLATIMQFVVDLAIYEKEPDAVVATESDFANALFGDNPQVHCLIAEIDQQAVGFAVYFLSFSTWLGQHGIYLEDLFVKPESRGCGAGKALLKELAKIAVANNYGRVEWSVLDWNEPSINFYKALGAKPQDEWTVYRLTDQALSDLAKQQ